jgi:hypothetical protein
MKKDNVEVSFLDEMKAVCDTGGWAVWQQQKNENNFLVGDKYFLYFFQILQQEKALNEKLMVQLPTR